MAGIYIHIPFCKQACYYCDFHFSASLTRKGELVASLCKELVYRKKEISQPIETIYFGGGTPSLLTMEELQLLMDTIYSNFAVVETPEITLEANPDDLMSPRAQSRGLFDTYIKIGINRLSIGIQSFFEEELQLMNRAHNAEEAKKCLSIASQYFENISIDLIYGIPGLSDEKWEENLAIACGYKVPHISSYALTVEPRTALFKFIKQGKIPPVEDAVSKRQYLILVDRLKKEGFVNYEFSNFGKEGYFSKNNTAYWQGKPYIGIGPSAHSFDGHTRSWNVSNNIKYIKSIAKGALPIERETLTITDKYNEYMMTGLRTMWGVSFKKVENDFGKKYLDYLLQQIKIPLNEGFLEIAFASKAKQSFDVYEKQNYNNEITSSPQKEGTPRNDKVLKITKKGKFLSDGISSDLFWID